MSRLARLRTGPFLVAIVLLALVLLAELGIAVSAPFLANSQGAVGWGIPALALIDAQLLFTVGLMAAPLIIPESLTGRIQGVATLIAAIILFIAALLTGIAAFVLLNILIALLTALPFGPVIYAGLGFATFPKIAAATTLAFILGGKLGAVAALVVAHQRFLENKGLMLLVATSLLASVVVSFLHGFLPMFLAAVGDLVATLIVVVMALVWAVAGLIQGAIATIKAIA